jgi:Flp pilus assembly protein TadG
MKLPKRIRVLCKADHGASLMEMALVTPFFVLLALGAVDFGLWYCAGLRVVNAAHAGAEYGSLHNSDTTGITTAAQQSESYMLNLSYNTPVVTYGCECSDGTSYTLNCPSKPTCTSTATRGTNVVDRAQVTTSASYTTLLPWPGISKTITVSSTATIRGN